MLAVLGAITTSATSTGSPLLISPSLTNTFGPLFEQAAREWRNAVAAVSSRHPASGFSDRSLRVSLRGGTRPFAELP
jgi:hypothetical protein